MLAQVVAVVGVLVEHGLELSGWLNSWNGMVGGESIMRQRWEVGVELLVSHGKAVFLAKAKAMGYFSRARLLDGV